MHIKSHRTGAAITIVLTCVVVLAVELIKFTGPQFDLLMSRSGVMVAAVTALATFALPIVITGVLTRGKIAGSAVWLSVLTLAALRIVTQFATGDLRLWISLLSAACAVSSVVIVSAVASRFSSLLVARSIILGFAISMAISLTLSTFEPLWRDDLFALGITAILLGVMLGVGWLLRAMPRAQYTRGLWALGPVLMLGIMVFANPAFVASQANVPLWVAGASMLLMLALSTAATRSVTPPLWFHAVIVFLGLLTIYLVPSWPQPSGILISIVVVLASALVGASSVALLVIVLERSQLRTSWAALAGASGAAGLLLVVPILLFQLDYDVPLPFDNAFVIIAAGLVLVAAAVKAARYERISGVLPTELSPQFTSHASRFTQRAALVLGAVGLAAGTAVVSPLGEGANEVANPDEVSVLNWNLHYGVSLAGTLEWDKVVNVIETSNADVVALQEVSRGWFLGGGGDMLTYLTNKLDMNVAFVGAADLQFGNALLWKSGIDASDVQRTALEYGEGPQARSAISAQFSNADNTVTLTSVHLQHRDTNTPTRLSQLEDLFTDVTDRQPWVIAGDFNAEPGWPEIQYMQERGFESAIDVAGDPNALTFPSTFPQQRIDWIFTSGITSTRAEVLESDASDHLPILTTLTFETDS